MHFTLECNFFTLSLHLFLISQAKGTVRVREVRETREEARPVSRRGLHPAGRGIDPVQNEPEIKTISEENPVKQQKKKSNKKKLTGKSGTGKSTT
jgi:hypothetical protein